MCAVTHLSVDELIMFIVGLSISCEKIPREEWKPGIPLLSSRCRAEIRGHGSPVKFSCVCG